MNALPDDTAPVRSLLSVRGLTKTFPGLRALDGVNLSVHPGEVVAVVGQNGSGKSTLVKLLAGVLSADSGGIHVHRADGEVLSGDDALEHLHFIHQDLGLVSTLSTVENLDLGRSLGRGALTRVRRGPERRRIEELIAGFGEVFDVDAPVGSLAAAEQRIVAIARALSGWTQPDNVLVLDEPTVALPLGEVNRLFDAVRRVAANGAGVIFISHRLDEVLGLADRIVVLRDGRLVADVPTAEVDHDALIRLITGRALSDAELSHTVSAQAPVLSARGICGLGVRDFSVECRAGEIVGVGGLLGSGQEHVASLLFGAQGRRAGEVDLIGQPLRSGDPGASVRAGLAFIPADRHRQGAVMTMSTRENLTLVSLTPLRRRFGRLSRSAERVETDTWMQRVALSPPDPERPLNLFSGGNQQKVVLAKWLRTTPRVLLLDEPTQGVDVGAKAAIYTLIGEAARAGAAVLVTSSDMKELAFLCHRVLVMRDGAPAEMLDQGDLSEATLVAASLGVPTSREPGTDHDLAPAH